MKSRGPELTAGPAGADLISSYLAGLLRHHFSAIRPAVQREDLAVWLPSGGAPRRRPGASRRLPIINFIGNSRLKLLTRFSKTTYAAAARAGAICK